MFSAYILSGLLSLALVVHCIKTGRNFIWVWVIVLLAFSPTAAMRAISMKLSGTDLAHQRHFEEAAEQYRRRANIKIDQWDMDNTRGLTSFDDKYAGDALWRSVDAFHYTPPNIAFALRAALPDLGVMLAWAMAACGLLVLAARRLRP